ncbi:hypothetical protein VPH35_098293 [Triticum aestivum]|uniref:Photosystem 1 subunit 5 n=1 Tax=Triticum aestivum TaxID=4565 RepID=Q2L3U6_WHEAT|nr:photosystem 1 subunit 5 [Triticum aestivum]
MKTRRITTASRSGRHAGRQTWEGSAEEGWVVSVAGGGEDVVGDDVADGAPGEDVDEVEADGVVGLEDARELLGALVAGLEVGLAVLLGDLLRHVLPLEVEEDEAAHHQRQPRAEADHHRRLQRRPRRHGPPRRRPERDGRPRGRRQAEPGHGGRGQHGGGRGGHGPLSLGSVWVVKNQRAASS